jgi:hypothetical protein
MVYIVSDLVSDFQLALYNLYVYGVVALLSNN